jgi:3-oxoadipate enol-lactonase
MWDRQVAVFTPNFTVVRCDLRGFGDSPLPAGPLSFSRDLRELLDELAIDRCALVGSSFGGRVALDFAVAHAERVTKLVLVAAALRDFDWSPQMRSYFAAEDEALERGDIDGAIELNLEMWVQPHLHDFIRPMQRRAFEVQLAGPDEGEAALEPAASTRLGDLRMPTLVLVGDRDVRDFQELAERFAREIPSARLEVIEGAGHLPSLERPDEFDRLLAEFLRG